MVEKTAEKSEKTETKKNITKTSMTEKKAVVTRASVTKAAPVKTITEIKGRNIGVDVPIPANSCNDMYCPFHGTLPVRGQIIVGKVVSDKMNRTVVVKRDYLRLLVKYERYEKRTGKYSAHNPPCIDAKAGEEVTIAECRPISKTVSFVVIGRKS